MTGVELALAAAAVSAVGTVSAGIAANNNAKFQSKVAQQNADIARQKAAVAETSYRQQANQALAHQRALFANSGVTSDGSPLLTQEQTAANAELQALTIRHGGALDAAAENNRATLARFQGSTALSGSLFQAGSTLLNGASNFQTAAEKAAAAKKTPVD